MHLYLCISQTLHFSDFGAASLNTFPSSGQEARPSPTYTELVYVLVHATEKMRSMLIRKRRASPALMDCGGPLKRICPSPRCSPPPTAPSSPLEAPRGAQATSLYWRPLKVRDTPGFLPAGLLQVAGSVHAVRDV